MRVHYETAFQAPTMITSSRISAVPLAVLFSCMLGACKAETPGSVEESRLATKQTSQSCDQRLTTVVSLLWREASAKSDRSFGVPLRIVEQEYELVDKEPYYVLGKSIARVLRDRAEVETFIASLRQRVDEQAESGANPRELSTTEWLPKFQEHFPELAKSACVMTLETGDAEHVMAVGFDPVSHLAAAVYVN